MSSTHGASIGQVCSFLSGGTPSRSAARYFQGDTPWITGADITSPIVTNARSFVTAEAVANSATNRVPAGTILLVTRTSVGKVATAGVDLCFSQDITALKPDSSRLYAPYLVEFLKTQEPYFSRQARGATIKGITRQVVKDVRIPLPPLPEQRRIAEVLDRADALRVKRRTALAQLDSLTQSVFLDMFGNPVSNPLGWDCMALADAVAGKYGVKAGPFGSSLKKQDYATRGYRVYGQEQVIAGRFDVGDYYVDERKYQQLKSCAVAEGDLLLSLVGSFGKVLVVPSGIEPGIINPRLLKVTPNRDLLTPVFLAHLLAQSSVQATLHRVAHGGTMGILNAGLLKALKVILPPLSAQQTFAARITAVDRLKAAHCAALTELDALFASLQHRAFRGEL